MATGAYATNIAQLNMTLPKSVTDNYYTYSYGYASGGYYGDYAYVYFIEKPGSQVYNATEANHYLLVYTFGNKSPQEKWAE